MALTIRLRRNEIKSNPNYGKYFGHVMNMGEVTIDQFAKEIEDNCSMKRSDVVAVLTELQATMKRHLQDGQVVVLPEIGRLKLGVETIGVDDPKDFNLKKHLKRVVCKFKAAASRGGKRNGQLKYNLCEGVKIGKKI